MRTEKPNVFDENVDYYLDRKTQYITKTFSRTKRKDYENYVINAIWNRMDNELVRPVTQQYVINSKTKERYFIDLYFPQLLVGIEVQERHHAFIKDKDYARSEAIWFEINKIVGDEIDDYKEIRIIVYNKTFAEIEEQINDAVVFINNRIKARTIERPIYDAQAFLKTKQVLTIHDNVIFPTINDVCNLLYKTNYLTGGGRRSGYFLPKVLYGHERFKHAKLWFPKLAIAENGILKAASANWNNRLNVDGSIIEFNEEKAEEVAKDYEEIIENITDKRFVFARFTDPLGQTGYKFIGEYHKTKQIAVLHNGIYRKGEYYTLISHETPVL